MLNSVSKQAGKLPTEQADDGCTVPAVLKQGFQFWHRSSTFGTEEASQKSADLVFELVERLRQGCVASDLVHKLATGNVLKDNAAGVLAQSEGQEGALQVLLSIGLDVYPVPINAKGLGEQSASWHHAGIHSILLCLPASLGPASSP